MNDVRDNVSSLNAFKDFDNYAFEATSNYVFVIV